MIDGLSRTVSHSGVTLGLCSSVASPKKTHLLP